MSIGKKNKYKSHYHTILNWARSDEPKRNESNRPEAYNSDPVYDGVILDYIDAHEFNEDTLEEIKKLMIERNTSDNDELLYLNSFRDGVCLSRKYAKNDD